ncbi:MAG: caspase family protein [Allosphingosinicella sp.]
MTTGWISVTLAALLAAAPALAYAQAPDDDMAAPLPPVDGRRVALVIGISDYDESLGWRDLPNAAHDAAHIAGVLGDPARGAARFDVTLVTDGTREEILARLARFAGQAAGADIALVYFSGHGFEYNLDNYIVPADAPGRVDESNVAGRYVNMSQVVRAAAARGFSLFFLDACRNPGPVLRFTGNTAGDRASMFGAIQAPQSAVFYSTAMGDFAYDDAPVGSELSPFAAAVGRAMNAPGLDVPYMFTRVREAVLRATRDFDPAQVPQLAGSWSRPFYFMPPRDPAAATAAAPRSADPAPAARLDIPLATLSTLDEPILMTRVLEQHEPAALLRMAEGGDPVALYMTGWMYEFGVGLPRDLGSARRWLERAAATGHPAGQLELGYFLLHHGGSPADRAQAFELYRAAAGQDYAKAKSHLGSALLVGTFGPPDREAALRLFREASAGGHGFALQALTVIGEDRARHIAALEALAASGNAEGDNWLCEIAAAGIAVDEHFARCLAAARAGYANARAFTALLYRAGNGVEASPSAARYWARLALSASDLRAELRRRLAEFPELAA